MIFYVFKHAGLWILLNSERYPFLKRNFEKSHTNLVLSGAHSEFRLGLGSNRVEVVFFQFRFLTEVVLAFLGGGVVFKTGVAFKRIRYLY